jgi:hypothetical protein
MFRMRRMPSRRRRRRRRRRRGKIVDKRNNELQGGKPPLFIRRVQVCFGSPDCPKLSPVSLKKSSHMEGGVWRRMRRYEPNKYVRMHIWLYDAMLK